MASTPPAPPPPRPPSPRRNSYISPRHQLHKKVSGTFESSPDSNASQTPTPPQSPQSFDASKTRHPRGILRQSSSRMSSEGLSRISSRQLGRPSSISDSGAAHTAITGANNYANKVMSLPVADRRSHEGFGKDALLAPAVPVEPRLLFPNGPIKLSASEAHAMVERLEKRLQHCEELVGMSGKGTEQDTALLPSGTESSPNAEDVTSAEEWQSELRAALRSGSTVTQLRHLKRFCDNVFPGRFSEFEKKYQMMQTWLESEHATVSHIVLTLQAKRTFVLEHEKMLRNTVDQLKALDKLKQYVNPPQLRDLASCRDRLTEIETRGQYLGEKVYQLNENLQNLAIKYNTAMNIIFALLGDWCDAVANLKQTQQTGAIQSERRKSVVFVDAEAENEV